MQWKNVYVFISSTFNDMHAERDYLVKRVFPELRRWCAQRKLKLMDIDLRWGVSEADALENKRVVEVCMRNIDRCRPFFLCFLGQRRGWVPGVADVNPATLEAFPALRQHLGQRSVTELEILHALTSPLDGCSTPVSHARFYFRDSGYLKDLDTAHTQLFCPKKSFLSFQDRDLEQFKKQLSKQYPTVTYTASWNSQLPSPELTGPLSKGRLENFRAGNETLESDLLNWLRAQIAEEFPEHMAIDPPEGSLEKELEQQDTQLFQSYDGYISRPHEENAIHTLLEAPDHRPLILLAEAGCGKTSLLSHLIHRYRDHRRVYYRFVGTTPQSFHLDKLSASLVRQWIADGLLSESEGNYTDREMQLAFPHLLKTAAAHTHFLLILDGMDQLLGQTDWLRWLPSQLPEGSDVLVSLREGSYSVPADYRIHRLGQMTDLNDKIQMVRSYMSAFFKDVDEQQLARILDMGGSSNPLFMKIVLNELRQHGSFDTLWEILSRDYGSTPLDAFSQVLVRVGKELADQGYGPEASVVFLGCLACAQSGMDWQMLCDAAGCVSGWDRFPVRQLRDTIYTLARELEPFLVLDGDRISIRYDSLRRAIVQNYDQKLLQHVHSMLMVAFSEKAGREESAADYTLAVYHMTHATEHMVQAFFTSIPVVLKCIRLCGAELLADACDQLAQRGLCYVNLGRILRKAAARLGTHPQTLFAELRRYGGESDPILCAMLAQEEKQSGLNYLQPLSPPGLQGMVEAEYSLPSQTQDVVFDAPYLLLLQKDRLRIVHAQSRKTLNILYLDDSVRYHVTASKGIAYLSRWDNNSNLLGYTKYTLPDLEVLQEGGGCNPIGALWSLQVAEGKLFGLFQQHHTGKGVDSHLIDLTTGQVLFSHDAQGSCNVRFLADMALIHDMHGGHFWLLRTATGKILLHDTFLGTCHSTTGYILDGGANIYAAQGEHLYLWLSGAKLENGALQHLRQLRKYAIAGDSLALLSTVEPTASCSNLHVLGQSLLAESSGRIAVLDSDLQVIGHQDLGSDISTTKEWSGTFVMADDNTVAAFYEQKIQFIPLAELIASLQPTSRDTGHIAYDTFILDGQYYVLSPEMQRTDLRTLETVTEVSQFHQLAMTYTPWNVRHTPVLAGTGFVSGKFCLKDTQKMELWLQKSVNDNSSKLLHAFTFRHGNEDWAGLVVADTTPVMRLFQGKEKPFLRCHLRTQEILNLACHYPWYHTDLEFEIADPKQLDALPSFVAMEQDGYLIFPNVYANEEQVSVKVYSLAARKCIYSRDVSVRYGYLSNRDLQYIADGFILSFREQAQSRFLHMDLVNLKAYTGDRTGGLIHVEPFATHVFFYDSNNQKLECYHVTSHILEKVIELPGQKRYNLEQVLLLDDWLILRQLLSDTLEVYDYTSGKKLFDQRLETQVERLTADPKGGTLCMYDPSGRTAFWKKHTGA